MGSCEPVACCKLSNKTVNKLSDNYRRNVENNCQIDWSHRKKSKSLNSIWSKYIYSYNVFMNNFPVFMLNYLTNKWIFTPIYKYPKNTHFTLYLMMDLFKNWSTFDPKKIYVISFQKLVFLCFLISWIKKKNKEIKKLIFGQFSLFLFRLPC